MIPSIKKLKLYLVLAACVTFAPSLKSQYCAAGATSAQDYIVEVTFGTPTFWNNLTNGQSAGGYGDFSANPSFIAEVKQGTTHNISIQSFSAFPSATMYTEVFIDWDGDFVFEDYVDLGLNDTDHLFSGTITVPPGTPNGTARMRVFTEYQRTTPSNNPCRTISWGEAEDYTLIVCDDIPNAVMAQQVDQNITYPVSVSSVDNEILAFSVNLLHCKDQYSLKSVKLGSADSDDITNDVSDIKIYYGADDNTFINSNVIANNAPAAVTDFTAINEPTLEGDNYYWVVYDIDPAATVGNFVDAEIQELVFNNGTKDTTIFPLGNPVGKREIVNGVCQTAHANPGTTRIENVEFANISNNSGAAVAPNAFSDYSPTHVADVSSGTFEDIRVVGQVDTSYTADPNSPFQLVAYADWNKDGDFDDPNETYHLGSVNQKTGATPVLFDITKPLYIPGNVTAGFSFLRVRLISPTNPPYDPCGTYGEGETEDYGLNICGGAGVLANEWNCEGNNINLTANSYGTQTIMWQKASDFNGPWTDILPSANITETTTEDTYYRLTLNSGSCAEAYSDVLVSAVPKMDDIILSVDTLCEGANATLQVDHNYNIVRKSQTVGSVIAEGGTPNFWPGQPLSSTIDFSGETITPAQNNYYSIDSVCLNISHANVADLRATLVHVGSGKELPLFDYQDLSGANLTNACFGPMATNAITTGAAPYSNYFLPVGNLSIFQGETNANQWELKVQDMDGNPGEAGTLDSWSMTFGRTKVSWSPNYNIVSSNIDSTLLTINPAVDTNYVATYVGAPCSRSDAAKITVIPQSNANVAITTINPATPICEGDSISFTGEVINLHPTLSASYTWYVNGVTQGSDSTIMGINNLPIGAEVIFEVTLSSSNCPAFIETDTVHPTVVPMFTPSISLASDAIANTICDGDPIVFSADTINPGAAPVLSWFVNGVTVVSADTFYVDNGTLQNQDEIVVQMQVGDQCSNLPMVADTLVVTVQRVVTPTMSLEVDLVQPTYCFTQPFTFTADTANGAGTGTLEWYHNNNLTSETAATWNTDTFSVGMHTIKVIYYTNYPCSPITTLEEEYTFEIIPQTAPSLSITADTIRACQQDSIHLWVDNVVQGDDVIYQWRLNGRNIAGATDSTYAYNGFIDEVILSVELISNSYCASPKTAISNEIQLEILELEIPTVKIEVDEFSICKEQEVTFNIYENVGRGDTSVYEWYVNGNLVPGLNSLTYVTDSINDGDEVHALMHSNAICRTKPFDESPKQLMQVNDSITSAFDLSSTNNPLCAGEASLFSVTGKVNMGTNPIYHWYVNGSEILFVNGPVTNIPNLNGGDTILVEAEVRGLSCLTNPLVTQFFAVDQHPVLDPTFSVDSVGVYAYQFTSPEPDALNWSWDFDNGFSSNSQNPLHTFKKAGFYDVCLTIGDENGCAYTSCDKLRVLAPVEVVSVFEFETGEEVTLYPNPANQWFTIEAEQQIESVSLRNVLGAEVLFRSNIQDNNVKLDVSELADGVYFVDVVSNGEHTVMRVTVAR